MMSRDPLQKPRPQTDRQRQARDRNWRVFKLRGLWWNSFPLTGANREAYRNAIDAELAALGAEPEGERQARLEAERKFLAELVGDYTVFEEQTHD